MFNCRYFFCQKFGNKTTEYEDAYKFMAINSNAFAIAISDGAAESSFSGDWAKMLTRNFVKNPFLAHTDLQQNIETLSKRWWLALSKRKLPWFAEEKAKMGAFATLAGSIFMFDNFKSGTTKGIAVGDSCIFHISKDSLEFSFPIEEAKDFGSSPFLISSNLKSNHGIFDHIKLYNREFFIGDVFLFMTDALACWFLREYESGKKPWQEIIDKFCVTEAHNEIFISWINKLREDKRIKNDDCTLLILEI